MQQVQSAVQQQTSRCSDNTHRRFFWSVGTILFIVWQTIFGIFSTHGVLSFFVGFGVLIGWLVGFAVAFVSKDKKSIRDWCRMRRDADDALLPQYVSHAIDSYAPIEAAPSYQQETAPLPAQQGQPAPLQGQPESRVTRSDSMNAANEGIPAAPEESPCRRVWRAFWVGIMPFAIIGLLIGLFLGLNISSLPRVISRNNDTILKVSFFCGILFGMLFTFPLVWLLSIMEKLGARMAKVNPAFEAQCDDSQYTTYGKVMRGAGRAIAISGWSSLFFVTIGAALGMLGSVFEGMGQGNGIAICFFIVLILLGLWGLWRLIKNRKERANAAAAAANGAAVGAVAPPVLAEPAQPTSGSALLSASSTNPFDYAAAPLPGVGLGVERKEAKSVAQPQLQLQQPVQPVVQRPVPVATIADHTTVPGQAEYVRAMTLLFGDAQNRQPQDGARLMLSAAQKGHPDALAQIKTILESTFAAPGSGSGAHTDLSGNTPCGPAVVGAGVYPTVAVLPVPSAPAAGYVR